MTKIENNLSPSRQWLSRMADLEDRCQSVSAGTRLVSEKAPGSPSIDEPRVLGQLVEFARRKKRWSPESLAEAAKVSLREVVALEQESPPFAPRSLVEIARVLSLPGNAILELAGLVKPRNLERLREAAIMFVAHSQPTALLSHNEQNALDEFVKVLTEPTAQDGQ